VMLEQSDPRASAGAAMDDDSAHLKVDVEASIGGGFDERELEEALQSGFRT
jgi:hypothetical protein